MNRNNYNHISTHIRNFYSEGYSSITMSFYKVNLSFLLLPFTGYDNNGLARYDKKGIIGTVGYGGAAALYFTAMDIIFGKAATQEVLITVESSRNTSFTLERIRRESGEFETYFSIRKNNESIVFKFETMQMNVKREGEDHEVIEVVESGLGAFMKTIEGYLLAINADRHLNKFGDDLEALQMQWHHEWQQQNATS